MGKQGDEAPGARWQGTLDCIKSEKPSDDDDDAGDDRHLEREATRVREACAKHAENVLSRPGAFEDELSPLDSASPSAEASQPLVHVVPLTFKRYDGQSTTLQFETGAHDWHAVFEHNHGDGSVSADTGRLDLDFGIVWRFPGDGQGESGWGVPDPENGWLSRFFCSSFDVNEVVGSGGSHTNEEAECCLHSTPLARRLRRAVRNQPDLAVTVSEEEQQTTSMAWSDEGHEYASLSLSLGTEFFVRRSARANFLLRRLEAAAEADEERQQGNVEGVSRIKPRRRLMGDFAQTTSACATPTGTSSNASSGLLALLNKQRFYPGSSLSSSTSQSTTSSGTSTPLPPWHTHNGRSFAAVASTPPANSSCFDRRGPPSAPPSRVLRQSSPSPSSQPRASGSSAPYPSAATSGYSSVRHMPLVDDKAAEEAKQCQQQQLAPASQDSIEESNSEKRSDESAASESSTPASCSSSSRNCTSKGTGASHSSIPRARFTARLLRRSNSATAPSSWKGGDEWGRNATAHLLSRPSRNIQDVSAGSECTTESVWSWTR